MSKFAYKGLVEILHLNTRKEGPDDEKILAAEVKLHAVMPREILDYFEPALGACLFLEGGAVRNLLMGPIQFHNELRHYRLSAVGGVFSGVTAKKFIVEPKDINQISLTFSVSFQPSGDEIARLAEFLLDAIEIDLAPENAELDLDRTE